MKLKTAYINILSAIITSPNLYYQNPINEEMFAIGEYRAVFKRYVHVLKEGQKPNPFTISDEFISEKFITDLVIEGDMGAYEESLSYALDQKKRTELDILANETLTALLNDPTDGILMHLEARLFEINDVRGNDIVPFEKQIDDFIYKLEHPDLLKGIMTGFDNYDNFSGGLTKGDLVIIAGETSQGKTSMALNMGLNAAKVDHIVFFSLEMSSDQLIARLTANISSIGSKSILRGDLTNDELNNIRTTLEQLKTRPISIHDCRSSDIEYIVNSIKAYRLMSNTRVVIIDYLQLMSSTLKGSKNERVGYMARRLKNLAKELDITIILLSQLSRDRMNPYPTLSRLRDSGEIEEAADQVIFIYRPERYKIDTLWNGMPSKGMAEMIVAKGRNIGVETFTVRFIDYLTKFDNYDAISDTYKDFSKEYNAVDGFDKNNSDTPF